MNIEQIIQKFNLKPLPVEGGFINIVYRAKDYVKLERGNRSCGDTVMYLITEDQPSKFHKLLSDEFWHFYAGDPVEQVIFTENKIIERELGNTNFQKHSPQALVPANYWQATKLVSGGKWALLGTSAFPAYDPADNEFANYEELIERFVKFSQLIKKYS